MPHTKKNSETARQAGCQQTSGRSHLEGGFRDGCDSDEQTP